MGRLSDIFDALETKLTASLRANGEQVPTFKRGLSGAAEFKSKPSIVLVPIKGDASPARASGSVVSDGAGGYVTKADPPAMWERSLQVGARIYADDIDACNEMAERLIEAAQDAFEGGCRVEGEEWDTSNKLAQGEILVVFFRFAARWERRPLVIVQPLTMEETPAIVAEL